ncbi:hypothetical protein [Streptomyces sp. CC208A]|uniref:hypothetical protein n=1 Tax=Streptomyces sp. CC208A TaxID=3044573 RepID=UPI0024A843F4|nr:hypothetical protein [Streptomyces sp. CC208A]
MRGRLLFRLFLVTAVVGASSVAATAGLTARTTARAIERQQGQTAAVGLWHDADPVRPRQTSGNLVADAIRHTPTAFGLRLPGRSGQPETGTAGRQPPTPARDRL